MKLTNFIPTPFFIVIFINTFLFFSCADSAKYKSREEIDREYILKNRIRNITEFKTVFRLGVPMEENKSQERFFDKNGLKIKEVNYNDDGTVNVVVSYIYDNNYNLIITTGLNQDSSLLFKEIRSYMKNGNREELIFYLPDGTYKYRNVAHYNKDNIMTELYWYWPDGLKAINKFKYDGNNKTEDCEYDPNNKFRYKWYYKYDGSGNLIQSIQYYPDESINGKTIAEYNNENQLTSQSTFTGESLKSKFIFEYDKNNLLTTKTEYSSINRVSAKYRYQYNFN